MAHPKLHLEYSVLDVFTNCSWSKGNPLAIVRLTKEAAAQITQEQKQLIAREFNFHETTFLHDYVEGGAGRQELRKRVDIFTKLMEVPFAGHPTIGTAAYCFNHVFLDMSEDGTLITKAGEISVRRDPDGLVGADIPCHNYRVHSKRSGRVEKQAIIQQHPELQCHSTTLLPNFPVISIAKGLLLTWAYTFSFIPIKIDSLETLAEINPAKPPDVTQVLDEDFTGPIGGGVMFYCELSSTGDLNRFQVRRMTSGGEEDPATGSAACAFSVWQSQAKCRENPEAALWKKTMRYEIQQGVEMGRKSDIIVDVTLNNDLHPQKVVLLGYAAETMSGELVI
ncbi:hypothetical protein N7474_001600 [Penicillium riverlandense]|uniref:uncharacterized protein n=1 Tax=Penicillium riverlandense TaxID=1903569 RepID=UPI002548251C|nr:uncharacterized protein N7474_001600 [Penicillium riverlandense]KAJ5833289.1 hypothetical protein N7474_001600 [Penicillium riverlandense]